MSYSNIPAGKDAPNDIYVIIEIPANAAPIKYEIDKDSDALFVDRVQQCSTQQTMVMYQIHFL